MSLDLYKVSYERVPTELSLDEETVDFLDNFILEHQSPEFYVDEQLLDETVEACREEGKDPPEGIVKFLREQMAKDEHGDFQFVLE